MSAKYDSRNDDINAETLRNAKNMLRKSRCRTRAKSRASSKSSLLNRSHKRVTESRLSNHPIHHQLSPSNHFLSTSSVCVSFKHLYWLCNSFDSNYIYSGDASKPNNESSSAGKSLYVTQL